MAGAKRTAFRGATGLGRGVRLEELARSNPGGQFDSDAWNYIRAVEAADGLPLERQIREAINSFVKGCKADSTWSAIKASCILAGARTLAGALTPLAGSAPTNNNFVEADYSRTTGLAGNGSTKYLGSNRNSNADPQDSFHMALYRSSGDASGAQVVMGNDGTAVTGTNVILLYLGGCYTRCRSTVEQARTSTNPLGLVGVSRTGSSSYSERINGVSHTVSKTSESPRNQTINVFAGGDAANFSSSRVAFYSVGEGLDLALLDFRLKTLLQTIGTALS